jgi:hypothetical protein
MSINEVPFTDDIVPRREPTLEERAEAAAREAVCTRCDAVILDEPSRAGVVFGRLMVPVLGAKHEFQLCGRCGLGLREYLYPEVQHDPRYNLIKNLLLTEHW